jgi:hypothetical protein
VSYPRCTMMCMATNDEGQKKAPVPMAVLIVCGTVIAITVILCLTVLSYYGKDASEVRSLVNTVVNLATLILSGGAFVVSGAGYRSAKTTEENTNGSLDTRITKAVRAALTQDRRGR